MPDPINLSLVAAALTGGDPLDFKQKEDGGLVVVAHTGQKFTYSAEEVQAQRKLLTRSQPQPPASKSATPSPRQSLSSGPARGKGSKAKNPSQPNSTSQKR